jgi:hypothetical protein
MALDLFLRKITSRNYARDFVGAYEVTDIPTVEQKRKAREAFYTSTTSIGLGVVSGLITHLILKERGGRK